MSRWRALCLCALVWTVAAPTGAADAPLDAALLASDSELPPADTEPWQPIVLPHNGSGPAGDGRFYWCRAEFEIQAAPASDAPLALYVPYLYNGARLFLNGALLANLQPPQGTVVDTDRPYLIPLPATLLRAEHTLVHVRFDRGPGPRVPRLLLGLYAELLPRYDRQLFWRRTVPQATVVTCALVAPLLLFIWLRRPRDAAYGRLAFVCALWGFRTFTFMVEQVPADYWLLWRAAYQAATGGFVGALAIFGLRFVGLRLGAYELLLYTYSALGPILVMVGGRAYEGWVARYWSAGLLLIAGLISGLSVVYAWRRPSWPAFFWLVGVLIGVAAGLHDYVMSWGEPLLQALAPEWASERISLLHHGVTALLVMTGAILTTQFVRALDELELVNDTLERRVAARESQLRQTFAELSKLDRARAIEEERARIMRDMHDGLGSQLFASLSRAERAALSTDELAEALRGCIAEMRMAFETLSAGDYDFQSTLGNFRYRWDAHLLAAGIEPSWKLDALDETGGVPVQERLQVLRVLQEALTNVLRHSHAKRVHISTRLADSRLVFEVQDDGRGIPAGHRMSGRGLENMRARARALKADLQIRSDASGTRIVLALPTFEAAPLPPEV